MGFTPLRKIYTLDFNGTDLDGLTVKACSVSAGSFIRFTTLADADRADVASTMMLFEAFAGESLRSWNLETDDGTPVPATLEGMLTLEFTFVFQIIGAWMEAMTGVDSGLKDQSPSGEPSLVGLPMTAPSSVSRAI
jgi:hypothetical protein